MSKPKIIKLIQAELRGMNEVLLLNTGDLPFRVAEHILKGMRIPLHIVEKRGVEVCIPTTLEAELTSGLTAFFANCDEVREGRAFMKSVPEELIIEYAAKYSLKGELPQKSEVGDFIERVHVAQPQTKASLRKSFEHLDKSRESME